ncbi:serine-type D-Ala-D-Ala carboxypeptidase (penicillin-binding protein 5/6) [Cytobacillus horneckiae]|uniref:serine-type D-Ala-D-Ala carboxypeptidase n=1 Tax=Cytobacillus horneckiae TaxID=549687 RepID=A0A2N0ZCY4_9BACI|nr:D-alanyl-D-alanine carboxypeptidase family protein [Cytobacillus horneckiae]MBN6888369.1 D-alanyl-D-alanine carboxypeptidase [Cytobacillus horneckiae]MCM3180096.1 D-alanyl-D-alanine carboxypeptidase [Cytobacillus horneckiae]MEC1156591.1 D-alanyl-D-alanine carboxypeptidase [Cytobacillus horneckiae]MED2938884.1 D-alanyl-D-alanine carboxypeptidase [Cytobacillus horneckiae]PKG27368.1 D-alanyl-D-alanine carboxypeptidase [Cytobacillus horneckiae]
MKKWNKLIVFSIITVLLFAIVPQKAAANVSVSARNAILIEQESGRILYEKAANDQNRIASITKIMTAVLAIESGKLEDMVKISESAVKAEGSSVYLKPGEEVKLEDLVYGLMLRSGNDAAVAIAEYVGGSLDGFVYLMNQKADEIGMKNTRFANPHGLDDHENHLSTAFDMAILTRYAMENETYQKIVGTEVHRAPNPTESWDRVWKNKNRLLTGLYKYTTGGKTGYTKRAKRTLVSSASKDNLDLIAVTLNGPDDWNDHIQMYENGFDHYQKVEVLSKGTIEKIEDDFYKGKVYLHSAFTYPVTKEEKGSFEVEYKLIKPKEDWEDHARVPEIVGKAVVYFENEKVKSLPIFYQQPERKENQSFFDYFRSLFTSIVGVRTDD